MPRSLQRTRKRNARAKAQIEFHKLRRTATAVPSNTQQTSLFEIDHEDGETSGDVNVSNLPRSAFQENSYSQPTNDDDLEPHEDEIRPTIPEDDSDSDSLSTSSEEVFDTASLVESDFQDNDQAEEQRKERITTNIVMDLKTTVNKLLKQQKLHSLECDGQLELYDICYKAFAYTLQLICEDCRKIIKCNAQSPGHDKDLLTAFYMGTVASGGTFESSKELLSCMNVRTCHFSTFYKTGCEVEPQLESVQEDSCSEAIQEEITHAVSNAEIDANGSPCITVMIDGAWNKRSFGHGYSASSGAAIIIGAHSKKVLFVGSRHKRCKACEYGNTNHKCYANWNGPPGGMESSIIVEGFQKIYQQHGVKFTRVIGDEDSSVYRKLKDEVEYGHQIEKLNCANHARKNLKKALIKLEESTTYAPVHRKILSKKRDAMVRNLQFCLKYSGSIGGTNVPGLKTDIKNILSHVFQDHSSCRDEVCRYAGNNTALPEFAELQNSNLYGAVQNLLYELSLKASRLRLNLTTNNAESVFSCLNKFNCGKRIDLASRGEFYRRSIVSAVNWNDHFWFSKWFQKATEKDPGFITMQYLKSKSEKRTYDKTRQRPRKSTASVGGEYGAEIDATYVDAVASSDVQLKLAEFMKTPEEIEAVQRLTDPSNRELYSNGRLEAHHIAEIIRTRNNNGFLKKIPAIASRSANADYILRNVDYIQEAFRWLNDNTPYNFHKIGTMIHEHDHFICCCPDGISEDRSMVLFVEVVRLRGMTCIREAAEKLNKFPLKIVEGRLVLADLNMTIQAAMYICKAVQGTVLFVSHENDMLTVTVEQDDSFWPNNIEKIREFFQIFVKYLVAKTMRIY